MKRKRLIVALPLALALVAVSGVVWASVNETVPRDCANITDGAAAYDPPVQQIDVLGNDTWVTPGSLDFSMTLEAPSCLDIEYGLIVLAGDPFDPALDEPVPPQVLASASTPGDSLSNTLKFSLELNEEVFQTQVCLYLYTLGGTGSSSTGKTGAAFDGTTGAALLDRAPDGPTAAATDPDGQAAYCKLVGLGSGGQGYN